MKDKTDKMIDRATKTICVLLVLVVGLTAYDAIVNAPENIPIVIKRVNSTINTEYFTSVSDLLYVLNNDNYEIYMK
jgi:phosphohistidine swiveling domain-containing protein